MIQAQVASPVVPVQSMESRHSCPKRFEHPFQLFAYPVCPWTGVAATSWTCCADLMGLWSPGCEQAQSSY